MPMDQIGPLPVFLSKISLELSQACSLLIVNGCYYATRAELSSCNMDGMDQKANIGIGLTKKFVLAFP